MATSSFKNIIVAGATGLIGSPITKALLSSKLFTVSALTRTESKATFPAGVLAKKVNLASHEELVAAFKGQDVLICTLNDAATGLQPGIIEAAYEAGIQRVFPNEWASHDLVVEGTGLVEMAASKEAIVQLLNQKVKAAEAAGKLFHWTGIDCGAFGDWVLKESFLEISMPPTKKATLWNGGNNLTTLTPLSTVAKAVLTALTTAETQSRDKLLRIQTCAASQNQIVASLEKHTREKWEISHTTIEEQLQLAQGDLEKGDDLNAFYRWIKAAVLGDKAQLKGWEEGNRILGVETMDVDTLVGKVLRGEEF